MSETYAGSRGESAETEAQFQYIHSTGLPSLLNEVGCTLWVSTYQAGKLIVVRAHGERLSTLLRTFDQAMGLAVNPKRLAVGTRDQIWILHNAPDIAPQLNPAGLHDACFLPRHSHVTGNIRCHEISWADDELWIVNTRFSCVCTIEPNYSFTPRWRPPFVTALSAEDRCHLNGLAVVDGQPKYVTLLGESDVAEGWRENKVSGGAVIDVADDETIARALCMPHSPRWYEGCLWILDSGKGRLATVELETGRIQTMAELPGYARGLAFVGRYAFVGLSQIRETSTFGGMPIAEKRGELKCGVWVVDIKSGQTVATLEFQAAVEEIFDVQLLPGLRFPAVIGFQKEAIQNTFVVPREAGELDTERGL